MQFSGINCTPIFILGGKTDKEEDEPLLLSLCVHADLDTQVVAISNSQLKLLHTVSIEVIFHFVSAAASAVRFSDYVI